MTDFSFYNKAYDLIQQVISEKKDKTNIIKSVNDLKLIIDITKDVNPLFSESDSKTITNLVKDTFSIDITEEKVIEADHMLDEIYRPVELNEIKPGITCTIESSCYKSPGTEFQEEIPFYYEHTFPVKEWYGMNKEMDIINYDKEFMFIWEKAKQGKALIKNTYKYKLENKVFSVNYPNGRGTIIKRRMVPDNSIVYDTPEKYSNKNEYLVRWANTEKRWENENNLRIFDDTNTYYDMINSNKTRFKRCYAIIERQDLIKGEDGNISYSNPVEERVLIGTHCNNIRSYVQKLYPAYTAIKVIRTEPWFHNEPRDKKPIRRGVAKQTTNTPSKLGQRKKQEREIPSDFKYVLHASTGVVCKLSNDKAKSLLNRDNGTYTECSNVEYQNFLNKKKENKDKLLKPGPSKMGIDPITKQEATRKNRRAYKQKPRRIKREYKEQFVPVIIPEKKEKVKITDSTWEFPFANEIKNITRPARVVLKRIFVYIKPIVIKITDEVRLQRKERSAIDKEKFYIKKELKSLNELKEMFKDVERRNDHYSINEKWSEIFDRLYILINEARLVYVEQKIDSQLKKKDVYSWIRKIIKEEAHLKWSEEKIDDFTRYIKLTRRGVFDEEKKYSPRPTGKRPIITHKDGTTHGGKPYKKKCKAKLPKKSVSFDVVKSITKIDYTKLRHNLPEENKPIVVKFYDESGEMERPAIFKDNKMWDGDTLLCTIKEVRGWHYPDKEVFEDIITDTGGGITEVPIKYRRSKLPFKN